MRSCFSNNSSGSPPLPSFDFFFVFFLVFLSFVAAGAGGWEACEGENYLNHLQLQKISQKEAKQSPKRENLHFPQTLFQKENKDKANFLLFLSLSFSLSLSLCSHHITKCDQDLTRKAQKSVTSRN